MEVEDKIDIIDLLDRVSAKLNFLTGSTNPDTEGLGLILLDIQGEVNEVRNRIQ